MSCKFCKHYLFEGCLAFDNIPIPFESGARLHDAPIKGQEGKFVFEEGTNEVLEYEKERAAILSAGIRSPSV